ncbi:MAG: N-acetylmuramoyl-L-alanine amidase [Tannerella sp.]|jgi:N-acetylmuramoyl-L-alanine amidase|nr:N-acetylmuramoyl-L-alanine amidase [Tannerella sp.]
MNRIIYIFLFGLLALLIASAAPAMKKNGQQQPFTVVIDAGHGGKDPGSIGYNTKEKAINLAVALKLGKLITDSHKDVNVIYTRKTDRFVELIERANIANRNNADLFISIHTNSVKRGKTVHGAETYTLGLAKTQENLDVAMLENSAILLEDNYEQHYEGFDPNSTESYIMFETLQNAHLEQSVKLASEIQKAFGSAKRLNRGVRQAGFLVLKATSMPSVLIELGFISNRDEEKFMRSEAGQNQLANSIYKAFAKYKTEHDTKLPTSKPAGSTTAATVQPRTSATTGGQVVYKVQILSSDTKLPANSSKLKGYKADYYVENKTYKYTYGESTDYQAIRKTLQAVTKDFKDAFVIRMQDGKRLRSGESAAIK